MEELSARKYFDSLAPLHRSKAVNPAARGAFGWIWLKCQGRPAAAVRFQVGDLAGHFGRSISTAQGWIDELQRAELVYVRNRRLGRDGTGRVPQDWVVLDVYHPNPELRDLPERPDPQRRFAFMEEAPLEPPFVAGGPSGDGQRFPANHAQGSPGIGPPGKSGEVPGHSKTKVPGEAPRTFRGKSPEIQKRKSGDFHRPCVAAVAEAAGSGQLSMGQAFRAIAENLPTPTAGPSTRAGARAGARSDIDIRNRNRNRNLDIDICQSRGQKTREETFFGLILQEVGDPKLRAQPVRKVARRLASGDLSWEVVREAIDRARQLVYDGKADATWIYFVGAMKRLFQERGWAWRVKHRTGGGR